MSEQEPTRHSFRKSAIYNSLDMPKNSFGQTVLSDDQEESGAQVEVYTDPEFGLSVKGDIFNSPSLQKFAESVGFNVEPGSSPVDAASTEDIDARMTEDHAPKGFGQIDPQMLEEFEKIAETYNNENRPKAPEVDEVAPRTKKFALSSEDQSTTILSGNCIDSTCRAPIKAGAKFCGECGKAQQAKYCSGCGFGFTIDDKFCTQCGTRR